MSLAPLVCRLGPLPHALVRLTALRELRIAAGSTLERLPAFLGRLASLERLHISVSIEGRCAASTRVPRDYPTMSPLLALCSCSKSPAEPISLTQKLSCMRLVDVERSSPKPLS